MIKPEDLCVCLHPYNQHKIDHRFGGVNDLPVIPAVFHKICLVSGDSNLYHECDFRFDNLLYLEQLNDD